MQYSQSGQLAAVMDALLAPLVKAAPEAVIVHREILRPAASCESRFPYPWPFWQFLDTFPETVAGDAPELAPPSLSLSREKNAAPFDLIILGYPVWFLSPPPVITAFLRSETARELLRGRPVVTVTACRNMWLMAQERVKELLADIGAQHSDHIALTDQGNAFATFITTPRWMFTGRKNSFLGLAPAGVAAADIAACARFGRAILDAVRDTGASGPRPLQTPMLTGLAACTVNTRLIASERIGIRSFRIWSKLLRACGRPGAPLRRAVLALYMVFLITAIITIVPASMLIKALLRPFLRAKLSRLKNYYEQPSGSGVERLALYTSQQNP